MAPDTFAVPNFTMRTSIIIFLLLIKIGYFLSAPLSVGNFRKACKAAEIKEKAKKLFKFANEYYFLLMASINESEFELVKNSLQITESYEEYINILNSGLKPENETIDHIIDLLNLYPEFQDEQYVDIIKYVINIIEKNPEKLKEQAYKKLMHDITKNENSSSEYDIENDDEINNHYNQDDTNNNESIDEYSNSDSYDSDSGIITFTIGNSEIKLETFNDPVLRHLYKIIFPAFENIHLL